MWRAVSKISCSVFVSTAVFTSNMKSRTCKAVADLPVRPFFHPSPTIARPNMKYAEKSLPFEKEDARFAEQVQTAAVK